jgi:hypothetical protein
MLLAAIFVVLSATQAAAPTTAPVAPKTPAGDPTALMQRALDRMAEAESASNRFTYFTDLRMASLSPAETVGPVQQLKYEVTYINGLLYEHLVERDGKPLTGPELAAETKRYDVAIHKKADLGTDKRASVDGYKLTKNDMDLNAVVGPSYKLTMVAAHRTPLGMVDEIDATLVPGTKRKSKCQWHFTLLVGQADGVLYRFVGDTSGDKKWPCVGEVQDVSFEMMDGLPEPKMDSLRFNTEDDGQRITFLNTTRYSDYKRFHSTMTLEPGMTVEPEPVPSGAPPVADSTH